VIVAVLGVALCWPHPTSGQSPSGVAAVHALASWPCCSLSPHLYSR